MAFVDMRLNLAVATVLLIVGAFVVVFLSRRKDRPVNKSGRWIIVASLVAGPVIAFGLWAADVIVFNPDMYPTAFQGDAMATLSGMMIIGTCVGVLASVVFAIALNVRRRSGD
jgi:purine-cytosine permease-like protein